NATLNQLDAQRAAIRHALVIARTADNGPRLAALAAATKRRDAIVSMFTANYRNDEDSIQRPGSLREAVPGGFLFGANSPPTDAVLAYRKRLDARFATAMDAYRRYYASVIKPLGLIGL
ncbi:MAG TPA: hypothetical protein VMV73_06305, partial [Candidatus Dormibacteraeota bacterium]|nr:hypothetical protein [Candidatus Dormibacteraeota bacterium]